MIFNGIELWCGNLGRDRCSGERVIKNVMASVAEAELAALFMKAQDAVALQNCLEAMGHPQGTKVKSALLKGKNSVVSHAACIPQ